MDASAEPPDQTEHRRQMKAVQAKMRARIKAAREKRDLLIVHTGDGKGKSTAAFGMLARMIGHRRRCAVVQFIKSGDNAVRRALESPLLSWHLVGQGFTWDTQDKAADTAQCRKGWDIACEYLRSREVKFLLLDELNIALQCGYLPVDEVVAALLARAPGKHVVVTGRGAPEKLIQAADLVTEMREIKHPFGAGVKAQAGIEL